MTRPRTRSGTTSSFKIGEFKCYLIVNLDPHTNMPMEVFLQGAKQGSTLNGLLSSIAVLISHGLQSQDDGMADVCDALIGMTFEPNGQTNDPEIPTAKSISDYVARRLALDFLSTAELDKLGLTRNKPATNVQVSPVL